MVVARTGAPGRASCPTATLSYPDVWEALRHGASPIEDRPRVVDGVESASLATRAGQAYVVVRNPAADTYLKLDPQEHELLPLMDGTRSVKELVVEYYQRHGVLALPRIAALVRNLREQRFLAEPPLDAYAALDAQLHRREAGRLLERIARGFIQAELPVRGVDAYLAAWYAAWGRFFFGRSWLVLGIVLGLVGPLLFLLEAQRGRYELLHFGGSYLLGALLFVGLDLVTLAIHELGHGLAMKHAGRYVSRAGVMVYYGMPAAFVDTTDVWMSPNRHRLLVSFAGPWTGLFLGGLCAIGAYLLPTGPVGAFLFAWGFVLVLDNLYQFCPLLELDGYYLLVDLLDKPMLRARSLAFVRRPLWAKLVRRAPLTGEERLFAAFGLAAAGFTVFSVFLVLRVWETRFGSLVQEAWSSGSVVTQAALVLLLLVFGGPLLLGLWGLARDGTGQARALALRLFGLASTRWHRDAVEAIRAIPLWAGLPDGRLLEVARAMRAEEPGAGAAVVRQGEVGDRFYVIARGAFAVQVDGREVAHLSRGDYFGEAALLGQGRRNATVVAVEPGRVYSIDKAAFQAAFGHDLVMQQRREAAIAYRNDVAAVPIFQDLAPRELDLLLARLRPVDAAPGDAVIRQGDPGDRFYVIRSGELEVLVDGQMVAHLGPGQAFGEIALLLDVPRTATVQALTPANLLALEAADFRDLLAGYCGRGADLARLSRQRLDDNRARQRNG